MLVLNLIYQSEVNQKYETKEELNVCKYLLRERESICKAHTTKDKGLDLTKQIANIVKAHFLGHEIHANKRHIMVKSINSEKNPFIISQKNSSSRFFHGQR